MKTRQLFLDGDGVVAAFDVRALEMFGMTGQEYEDLHGSQRYWSEIEAHEDFFGSLPLVHDAMVLYDAVKHLRPIFLTGVPRGNWAAPQKKRWFAQHFPDNEVITCLSHDKYLHMTGPGDVLVDDFLKHRHVWEGAGGVFVHHTTAENSIAQLRDLGFEL